MQKIALAACAVAALTWNSVSASAATMQAVYTGTVSNSVVDYGPVFGVYYDDNGPLDGMAFAATIIYDTSLGTPYGDPTYTETYGGTDKGSTSPILSAVLTINGGSWSFKPGQYSSVQNSDNPSSSNSRADAYTYQYENTATEDVKDELSLYALAGPGDIPLDLTVPFAVAGPTINGYFNIDNYQRGSGEYRYAYGTLNTAGLTVSAIPLPASLPLMLAGLGALGLTLRYGAKKVS